MGAAGCDIGREDVAARERHSFVALAFGQYGAGEPSESAGADRTILLLFAAALLLPHGEAWIRRACAQRRADSREHG